jgi:hypothetical protein
MWTGSEEPAPAPLGHRQRAGRRHNSWAGQPIEVDRVVTTIGMVSLGNQQFQVGSPLEGQRVTIRLEGQLAYVILGDGRYGARPVHPARA